ncbi:uncharacterized protein LOC119676193 [Teleopsis dalmanni]|uniref:uncharacterized protein LOC119676193 n=1 Tax=Teleopsis dalmanni TaxID=139649 RepID=UPI0018CE0ED0|nr:uncharacterized protein LOC119676193 [Teleopsis dalmanni]
MYGYITIFLIVLSLPDEISGVFKLTNAICESHNKSWAVINKCRLKALRRDTTALYINVTLVEPVKNTILNMAILKKANGYKPFLYNITLDTCEYLAKRNNPLMNLIFKFVQKYLEIGNWCPYEGFVIVKGLYLKTEYLQSLPLPDGEYILAGNCQIEFLSDIG